VAIWWTLRRGRGPHRAICTQWTHALGHELRLDIMCNLVRSHVCRTEDEVLQTQDAWRAALEAKGWTRWTSVAEGGAVAAEQA
jgi:hypothetical protein